ALQRGAAPVPAVAPPVVRPGPASRRRALSLPSRHVWAQHPGRRRPRRGRLRLVTARGPGHRPQRPARRGPDMIDAVETEDARDRRFALGAPDVLGRFNAAGVLEAADVHTARRIQTLAGEPDDDVALAVGLAVRSLRHG